MGVRGWCLGEARQSAISSVSCGKCGVRMGVPDGGEGRGLGREFLLVDEVLGVAFGDQGE